LEVLKSEIEKIKNESRKQRLKSVCPTRWAKSHEAVSTYIGLHPFIIRALEDIITWKDSETSPSASQLLTAISAAEFQISCFIMQSVHIVILPLSRQIQSSDQDLSEAMRLADDASKEFEKMRQDAEKNLNLLFEHVKEVCSNLGTEIQVPRYNNRQMNRFNLKTEDVEAYYRIAFYIFFLDTYIAHLKSRFLDHKSVLDNFCVLFPKYDFDEKKAEKLFAFYEKVVDCSKQNFLAELKMWEH
jgi:hypothetical protein